MTSEQRRYWDSIEETTRDAVIDLETRCRMILATATAIPADDRKNLELLLRTFRSSFENLAWLIEPMRENHPVQFKNIYQMIFALLRASAAIGTAQAFTDAAREFHMAPIKSGSVKGGEKSARVRREKRETGWEPIARTMAKDIRKKNPASSQDTVVEEIMSAWKHASIKAPGHATLKALIGEMEKSGELPSRRRRI